MKYREFVGQVHHRAEMASENEAVRAIRATLQMTACAPQEREAPISPTSAPEENGDGGDNGMTQHIVMKNTAFDPQEITVQVGTTVTWVNQDGFAHTVTAGTRGSSSGLFNQTVDADGSFSYTFEEAGTYEYFCEFHPGMDGVVIVE